MSICCMSKGIQPIACLIIVASLLALGLAPLSKIQKGCRFLLNTVYIYYIEELNFNSIVLFKRSVNDADFTVFFSNI